jgi:nucleotide-binding universal stress UspA family protein
MLMTRNKVLIPLDEADFTLQIIPSLFQYLSPEENEVALLYVAKPEVKRAAPTSGPVDQVHFSSKTKFEREVQPYVRAFQHAGFAVSTDIRFGEPLQEIRKFIEAESINLVAMAMRDFAPDRAGSQRIPRDHTAYQMVQEATVPVMLYHRT